KKNGKGELFDINTKLLESGIFENDKLLESNVINLLTNDISSNDSMNPSNDIHKLLLSSLDIESLKLQLISVESELNRHTNVLSPMYQANLKKKNQARLLQNIGNNSSTKDYYNHIRFLLFCAHTGSAAILNGNIQTSGSTLASVRKIGMNEVPGLI